MDKQKMEAKEMMKKLPFKEKITNFWFYYKTHTLVLAFAAVVLIWSGVQCANRIDYDLSVSYCTVKAVDETKISAFSDFIEKNIDDINENGSIDADIYLLSGNINSETYDEQAYGVGMKIQAQLAANENIAYIADEAFKDYLLLLCDDYVANVIEISQVPEIKSALELSDDETLYWITLGDYSTWSKDEERIGEYENVLKLEALFNQKLEDLT